LKVFSSRFHLATSPRRDATTGPSIQSYVIPAVTPSNRTLAF
jgi:hypothetical protein